MDSFPAGAIVSTISRVLGSLFMPLVVGAVVFTAAGRVDLPMVWAVLAVVAVVMMAVALVAAPELVQERLQPGPGNQDRLSRPLTILLLFAHWILAGLDLGRFHWSRIPQPLQIASLAGYAVAMLFLVWAVRTNPFYSSVVRVQTDRGQHPITRGPYRFVRHPGYAATLAGFLLGGMALGSWVAMIPVLAGIAVFVRRTLLEDRMLQRELPGYADYAQQVRDRLIPGVF